VALIETVLAGLVVGLDNFAAAMALGSLRGRRTFWRIVLAFTAFGAVAPIVGALVGGELSERLAGFGAWIGAGVLALLGVWTLRASRASGEDGGRLARRASSGAGLVLVAAGLSVDNLFVGFGLGLHGIGAVPLAISAGAWVLVLTAVGLTVGDLARERWERRAHLLAGTLLLLLAAAVGLGIV
jgi:manganese efflux pump family protein